MVRTEISIKTIRGFIITFRPTKTTSISYNEAFQNFDMPFCKSSKNVFKRFQEVANMLDLNNFVLRRRKLTSWHTLRTNRQQKVTSSQIFVVILGLIFLFAIGSKWYYVEYLEIPELILQHSLISGHGVYMFKSYEEAESVSKKSRDKIHKIRQRLVILFSWLSCISAVFTSAVTAVISKKPHLVPLVTVYLIMCVLVSFWACQQMKGSLIELNMLQQFDLAKVCFLQKICTLKPWRIRRRNNDPISSSSYCLNHDFEISERVIVVKMKPAKAKCLYPEATEKNVNINAAIIFETMEEQRPVHCTEDTVVSTNACHGDQIKYKPFVDCMFLQTTDQTQLLTSDFVLECTGSLKRAEGTKKKTDNSENSQISSSLPASFVGIGSAMYFHLYHRGMMKYELMRLSTFQSAVHCSAIRLAGKGFFYSDGKIQCFSCSKTHDDRINSIKMNHQPDCRMALGTEYTNKLITTDTSREMFRELEMAVHEQESIYVNMKYKMNAEPRGIAIIINNDIFNGDMENRTGTHKDGEKLIELWKNLKFKVIYHVNKTAADITRIVSGIAQLNHTTYDCVVFCILTHGGYGVLYGTDCVPVEIQKLINFFRSSHCPTLAGKPKMFFIQACQGINNQAGQQLSKDSTNIDADTRKDIIADEADTLICFSTVSGSVSYRCPQNGTWFINSLVENLSLYSTSYDLQTILVKVNKDVGEKSFLEGSNIYKQIPMQKCSLCKLVFFS
ncbi:CASP8 [Mytilus coruscus]|uniref:CASP8 n=1 Tax=Mytilus coruscus TaxID=42192 RepID=A0A6J8BB67_MYTCO|nr:CASP8 [Mytilus coruscus]